MPNNIAGPKEPPDFSLVLGGPLYQLLVRSRLTTPALELIQRRIVCITLCRSSGGGRSRRVARIGAVVAIAANYFTMPPKKFSAWPSGATSLIKGSGARPEAEH